MLRKILDFQLSLTEKGKPLHRLRPLVSATDAFLYETSCRTKLGPHIRDAVDVKRWMLIVVIALIPCILMAIWNTGLQAFVYSSGNYQLMDEYIASQASLQTYFNFALKDRRYFEILKEGSLTFFPLLLISYLVGGMWEVSFACVRIHEISEGFLVTGMLYPLILPPIIPYWMAAFGISVGIILAKELFGGVGMNIVNPALACRAFLFFTFPGKMSGNVWVGRNPTKIRESLVKMNLDAHKNSIDGYSQATPLSRFNVSQEIKRIHVDAIATNHLGREVGTIDHIEPIFNHWNSAGHHDAVLGQSTPDQMYEFVTTPTLEGGLGLSTGYYEDASAFSSLNYEIGNGNSDWGFFLGNKLGSLGETSTLACLLGALFLIYTGVGSWRTMMAMGLGAYGCALLFELGAKFLGENGGAWNPAQLAFPAYKHLLLGGLAFGIVFMATDPVSSPGLNLAKWIYGLFAGMLSIVFRSINPAYPEGVMLAILIANVFAPLFDHYAARFVRIYRKRRMRCVRTTTS